MADECAASSAGWAICPPRGTAPPDSSEQILHEALLQFPRASSATRMAFLEALLPLCHGRELTRLESHIRPHLKVDFLQQLPMEVSLHILSYIGEPYALTRAAGVSRAWSRLVGDERIWGAMCVRHAFNTEPKLRWLLTSLLPVRQSDEPMHEDKAVRRQRRRSFFQSPADTQMAEAPRGPWEAREDGDVSVAHEGISLREYFQLAFLTERNWLRSGYLVSQYMSSVMADRDPDPNRRLALTCCAIDANYIVVGMTTQSILVFSARTGELVRTLDGHDSGVWCLMLASGTRSTMTGSVRALDEGGGMYQTVHSPPPPVHLSLSNDERHGLALRDVAEAAHISTSGRDPPLSRTRGWGQEDTYLVSAGSDRFLRVWNMHTGLCEHVLKGHTSTIRCVEVLEGRPLAVSGSRDGTLRVWDLVRGELVHVLAGHQHSVRCLATAGNRVASGSYDFTCRIWDVDTGQCLHILKGHHLQIYAIAFDGKFVVTGSSDSTVRVWDANTGACLAVFQGYTHVVAQLHLHKDILATGSGDGRAIVFSLRTFECMYRLCAHDSSVSTLQITDKFLVTGGADGLVKLWDARTGAYLRQLCEPCETVWSVRCTEDKCVILCTYRSTHPGKRHGRCSVEIQSFLPFPRKEAARKALV